MYMCTVRAARYHLGVHSVKIASSVSSPAIILFHSNMNTPRSMLVAALLLAGSCAVLGQSSPLSLPKTAFDPKTFNWAGAFTGYPQAPFSMENWVDNMFACSAPYALCAYANCTIIQGSKPLVAECGCVAYTDPTGRSLGNTAWTLTKSLAEADRKTCAGKGVRNPCFFTPNTASFCSGMQRNAAGKAAMYGGKFDLISTWNPWTWPKGLAANQGAQGKPIKCKKGVTTNCFSAPCLLKKSWNGMPATCYCPVYTQDPIIIGSDKPGNSCDGQSVKGVLTYVQNGL